MVNVEDLNVISFIIIVLIALTMISTFMVAIDAEKNKRFHLSDVLGLYIYLFTSNGLSNKGKLWRLFSLFNLVAITILWFYNGGFIPDADG